MCVKRKEMAAFMSSSGPGSGGDRQFKVPSPVQSGDPQFKMANRQFKVAIVSLKWQSLVQK